MREMSNFIDCVNRALVAIEQAAEIAEGSAEVKDFLKKCNNYEETYKPVFWVLDYINNSFED
jgi:hypothetical protein